ncbi:hypothetical protein AWR36_001380 [Microbulbifer flavimaris]|uniref:Secreted protein n=1 Tax=Microbulbifer flavimaris TaxID=1781068 RepID=A0ABX4I3I0_9GAMM|nr:MULTISPECIES: hypothetical protein [Microbulbifer]KUJ84383.1 hypothetical protein AVO43_01385 [Microbulbifer sp. ZGT114]PCO06467.1 hypothetical protein AWR36_001380 [Microbulbifer flavimaris]
MTRVLLLSIALPLLWLFSPPAPAEPVEKKSSEQAQQRLKERRLLARKSTSIYSSKPRRFKGELRVENLTDIEVRAIVSEATRLIPGAMVMIDAVRDGCPCADGPDCSAQVWVATYQNGKNTGLTLSKIGDRWTLGYVQAWWLEYEAMREEQKLLRRTPRPRPEAIQDRLDELSALHRLLWEEFPSCEEDEQ